MLKIPRYEARVCCPSRYQLGTPGNALSYLHHKQKVNKTETKNHICLTILLIFHFLLLQAYGRVTITTFVFLIYGHLSLIGFRCK